MIPDTHKELEYLLSILSGEIPGISGIDKRKFIYTLKFHRMISYLAGKIMSGQIDYLDEWTKDEILVLHQAGLAHKSALKKVLIEAAKLFSDADIPFIVFKGFHLSELIYPGNETRLFSDNDFLVMDKDFQRAETILLNAGYVITQGLHSKFSIEDCAKLGISRPYHHSEAAYLQIDLHSRLSINPGWIFLDSEDCWNRTSAMELDGVKLKILTSALTLIYLSWHAIKHSVNRMIWFRDLYLFMKKEPEILEQVEFFELLEKYNFRKMTASVLWTASKVFNDTDMITRVEETFKNIRLRNQKYFAPEKLFEIRDEISPLNRTLRDVRIIEKNRDRLNYLWRAFFPEPDFIPELKSKTNSRLTFEYLMNRFNALFKAVVGSHNN